MRETDLWRTDPAVFAGVLPTAVVYHVAAMILGHALTGFFLVWTVHHDVDPVLEAHSLLAQRLYNGPGGRDRYLERLRTV